MWLRCGCDVAAMWLSTCKVELFGYRNFRFGSVSVMFSKLQSSSVRLIESGSVNRNWFGFGLVSDLVR